MARITPIMARQGGLRVKREPERAFAGRPIGQEEL
jgi:hypothetical protein